MGEVCRSVTNETDRASSISRDLENEGIEMSNEKIEKIVSALKQMIQAFYSEYNKRQAESETDVMPEIQATLTEQLQMKTGLKSGIVTSLVNSLATVIGEQLLAAGNDRKKLF